MIWFYSPDSFQLLAEKLVDSKLIKEYYCDYENVFEWIEATVSHSINYNFSRKHCFDDDYNEDNCETIEREWNSKEPITFIVLYKNEEPSDTFIEQLADNIKSILNVSVFLGEVNYISGNNFEYIERKRVD